jgi:hypothetical protein
MTSDTDVSVEICAIADLGLNKLRERWQAFYGSPAPKSMSRELLIRAVAYRIQEERFGGLPPAVRARLLQGARTNGTAKARAHRGRSIKPGTRFLREWNGRTHEVTATADGKLLYSGKTYRSLSAIAREITGTRWSGPAFFGLKHAKGSGDASQTR